MKLKPMIKKRFSQTWRLYLCVFLPMWVMFILNNSLLFGVWNSLGIIPREMGLSSMIGIALSWTMHGNLSHIMGNSLLLVQVLFLFGVFEKNPYRTVITLILASGFLTWLLGSPHSMHIGASGLAFAMLGFMLGGAIFAKRWGYLIACVLLGAGFWAAMMKGLIPQAGISFSAHFGGLIAGVFFGSVSEKKYHALKYK